MSNESFGTWTTYRGTILGRRLAGLLWWLVLSVLFDGDLDLDRFLGATGLSFLSLLSLSLFLSLSLSNLSFLLLFPGFLGIIGTSLNPKIHKGNEKSWPNFLSYMYGIDFRNCKVYLEVNKSLHVNIPCCISGCGAGWPANPCIWLPGWTPNTGLFKTWWLFWDPFKKHTKRMLIIQIKGFLIKYSN